MNPNNKPVIQVLDEFELIKSTLYKNGLPSICPHSPSTYLPSGTTIKSPNGPQFKIEEKKMPCNRTCPQSILYKVNPGTKDEKTFHQTRCHAGWPSQELKKITR